MLRIKQALLALLALTVVAVAAFLAIAPGYVERSRNVVQAHAPFPVSDAAKALHADLTVGDWHADSLLWQRDIGTRGTRGHVDVPRLIEGGVALQVFTAVTKSPAGQNIQANDADAFDTITPLAIGQLWPPRTW
ncbi:MAG: peptidase M19, partial [Pseudomonadota bacterium]